ncbi:hypothetical protein N7463_002842 [Penicillium fimorum]|uniref:Uncharacterized protein n=1 Tax=Penicillium fimorum TaxID=1882269 RepID=A0A9X0C9D9_9EURO|nr:hypothetical protein N7463_002842 [Penicillium fimorum]
MNYRWFGMVKVGGEDVKLQATRPGASSVIRQARTTSPHQSFAATISPLRPARTDDKDDLPITSN